MSDTTNKRIADTDASAVVDAARAGEPDRYLAALLASPPERPVLLALAAFSAELARIPVRAAREPTMAEIRLQWWRDALALPAEQRTGHPVADALRQAARTHNLPANLLDTMIDGRALLLEDELPPGEEAVRDLLWKTEGALFALGAHVVGLPASADVEAGCAASGQAYGWLRLLVGLPQALARGRVPVGPAQLKAAGLTREELLAGASQAKLIEACAAQIRLSLPSARQFAAGLCRPARVPFLPLALVEPYLRVLERAGYAPREELSVSPLTRVRRIAGAHLLGRI